MDLNQICITKKTKDIRPGSQKDRLKRSSANVSQANPDNLGWGTMKHDSVKEIRVPGENRVPGDNRPVMQAGMIPKLPVCGLFSKICSVRALNGQKRYQGIR